jgi:transcriptional regulator with XRE-family HTH domain
MKQDAKSIHFGQQLRNFRLTKGITIQQLSEATGLSNSFISLLENEKTDVSFSNMQKILQYFGLTIADLMINHESNNRTVRLNKAKTVTKVRLKDAGDIGPDEQGIRILELVHDKKNKKIWPGYFIMQPGAAIGPMQHKGEEFSHIIQGIIEVRLLDPESGEEETHILHKGDTIYYSSMNLHTYINRSTKVSIFIAAVTPPTF